MEAAREEVLAVRKVGVTLGFIGSIPNALVDPALEKQQASKLVALGFEVAGVRKTGP